MCAVARRLGAQRGRRVGAAGRQFAVGGGFYLAFAERKARREGREDWLGVIKMHSKFFLILTGVFGAVSGALAQVGTPWSNVAGNHDLRLGTPDEATAVAAFESAYGPSTFAFHAGPASSSASTTCVRRAARVMWAA